MALRIVRSELAKLDLLDIWQFIAEDNGEAADRLLDRVEAVLRTLAEHPEAGRGRPELGKGIRSFPVGAYVLFYRIEPGAVALIRVRNSYRDLDPTDLEA